MRFYTLDIDRHDGIKLTDVDGLYWILVGTAGASETEGIPLSPFFSDGARQLGLDQLGEGLIAETEHGTVVTPLRTQEGRARHDSLAVVHVKTPPGSQGVKLTQTTYDEYVDEQTDQVMIRYHDFMSGDEPPPGITVLATNTLNTAATPPTHPEWLLLLMKGASFRVDRLGTAQGAATLAVRWTGFDDFHAGEHGRRRPRGLNVKTYGQTLPFARRFAGG